MSGNRPWRPTGGKNGLLEGRLNAGLWNGRPIYIHFTSHGGYDGINLAGKLNATPKTDRRGMAAKDGIYLNPVLQTFSPLEAFMLLFFETEKYRSSATHCFVFSFLSQPGSSFFKEGAIAEGSWVREIIYGTHISFKEIDILYRGPNPFVAIRHQNYPDETVRALFQCSRSG